MSLKEYYRIADEADENFIFCTFQPKNIKQRNGFYRITSHSKCKPEYGSNMGFLVQINCDY